MSYDWYLFVLQRALKFKSKGDGVKNKSYIAAAFVKVNDEHQKPQTGEKQIIRGWCRTWECVWSSQRWAGCDLWGNHWDQKYPRNVTTPTHTLIIYNLTPLAPPSLLSIPPSPPLTPILSLDQRLTCYFTVVRTLLHHSLWAIVSLSQTIKTTSRWVTGKYKTCSFPCITSH